MHHNFSEWHWKWSQSHCLPLTVALHTSVLKVFQAWWQPHTSRVGEKLLVCTLQKEKGMEWGWNCSWGRRLRALVYQEPSCMSLLDQMQNEFVTCNRKRSSLFLHWSPWYLLSDLGKRKAISSAANWGGARGTASSHLWHLQSKTRCFYHIKIRLWIYFHVCKYPSPNPNSVLYVDIAALCSASHHWD